MLNCESEEFSTLILFLSVYRQIKRNFWCRPTLSKKKKTINKNIQVFVLVKAETHNELKEVPSKQVISSDIKLFLLLAVFKLIPSELD